MIEIQRREICLRIESIHLHGECRANIIYELLYGGKYPYISDYKMKIDDKTVKPSCRYLSNKLLFSDDTAQHAMRDGFFFRL